MTTPAFPSANARATASGVMTEGHAGLTKRELFAAMAMQSYIQGAPTSPCWVIAELSALMADAQIKELEKEAQ
jgi:hypothetical protein